MGKTKDRGQLTTLMAVSLRHKIGAVVNKEDFYASKYAKDAQTIMKAAEKVLYRQNWSNKDKAFIRAELRKKLRKELEEKDFLDDEKFNIMDEYLGKAIKAFDLD